MFQCHHTRNGKPRHDRFASIMIAITPRTILRKILLEIWHKTGTFFGTLFLGPFLKTARRVGLTMW